MEYTAPRKTAALFASILLIMLALVACSATMRKTGKFNYAWYIGMEFEPDSSYFFEGLPVGEVDHELKYVRVLSAADVPATVPDHERPGNNGHFFLLVRDVDKDGIEEDIYVGVYEDKSGERGMFILISKKGKVEYFRKHPGPAGFSVLCPGRNNSVLWAYCINCDAFDTITWNGNSFDIELYDGRSYH